MLKDIDLRIQEVLTAAIGILFPVDYHPVDLLRRHVWRDRRYVGAVNRKPLSWRGWSANLVTYDSHYRAVFVDAVDNLLPPDQRVALFGEDFAAAIEGMPQYVVLFVLDFPIDAVPQIRQQGFTPRLLTRSVHACVVASPEEFLTQPVLYWAAQTVKLVLFQRVLSTHRKPLSPNELPLQHLLYHTGYLHSYIVRGGLGLVALSEPRKAGDFGHDLHALVVNPARPLPEPLSIGIEVYTGAMAYDVDSIPAYVRQFALRGIIVIAKDNPFPRLRPVMEQNSMPVRNLSRLSELGTDYRIGVHHLELERVITELAAARDEIDALLP